MSHDHRHDQDTDEAGRDRHVPPPSTPTTPAEEPDANPPYTTTGKITSPKFGAAGSGGAEFEPGPERD